jgi:UDPglucose 6-dehydrogenase
MKKCGQLLKNNMKVGFIGVGKLGKDAAEVMHEAGHDVLGYDTRIINDCKHEMTSILEDVCKHGEIIFIAVPTPHHKDYDGSQPTSQLKPKDFDYSIVKKVLEEINEYTNKKQLVVLISTVLPGTIRREFIPLVKNYRFIYNPYLIAMGTVKEDMKNPEMVIIGTEDGTETGDAKLLIDFYETFVNKKTRCEIGTWDDAEAIKIFYNTFISAKISLVNMIMDVAEKNGNMNTDVVTGALERSTYRIMGPAYMKAGMGDGGACHPRDNIALRFMAREYGLGYDLFDAIMSSRESQATNIASRLIELSETYSLPIVIMGESYKPGVPYTDGSYSRLIANFINIVKDVEYDKVEYPAIYLLGHRKVFNETVFPIGSVVLDPWRERNNPDTIFYGGK